MGWVVFVTFIGALFAFYGLLIKTAGSEPPLDPALIEDRVVAYLDALWDLPEFDPEQAA